MSDADRRDPFDSACATVVATPRAPQERTEIPDPCEARTELVGEDYGDASDLETARREPASAPAANEEEGLPDDPAFRYEDLGLIGRGTMGEVRRVRDRDLNRVVAMKIVRRSLTGNRRLLARFISEAQAAAQLAHPSIVPVHELGVLPDRRFFFTMKEIRGETLREVIRHLHEGDPAWSLGAVVDALRRACDAVAHAHARAVLHRDLKPDNVMVGRFGEVLVLDWGLAKVLETDPGEDPEPVITNRSIDAGLKTHLGTVAGTPCYMPPEQAAGCFGTLGPEADVYALGAMLYEVLVGRPPYDANAARELLARAADPLGLPVLAARESLPPLPRELAAVALKAMHVDPASRYPNAGAMVDDLLRWTEGEQRRARARELAHDARLLAAEVEEIRAEIRGIEGGVALARRAAAAGAAPSALYAQEDRLREVQRELAAVQGEVIACLRAAVAQAPEEHEPHRLLADHYREALAAAERRRDPAAQRLVELLRVHDRGAHGGSLAGTGYVSVATDPPGVAVYAAPLVERDRRLVPGDERFLGRSPLMAVRLPIGAWELRLRDFARDEVRVPVRVDRLGYWDGVPPGGDATAPIRMAAAAGLTARERLVPGGWFRAGADPLTRVGTVDAWLEPFVVDRDPVVIEDLLPFLAALAEDGLAHEAARFAGALWVGGRPALRWAEAGWQLAEPRLARLPATGLCWSAAAAYAAWRARRDGLPWRLPTELEWEKAARGVDGRAFPWGDRPAWGLAATAEVVAGVSPVDVWPGDEGPYGARGFAGNAAEWCADPWGVDGPLVGGDGLPLPAPRPAGRRLRVVRGGCFRDPLDACHVGARRPLAEGVGDAAVGFRLVRSVG